MNLAEILASPRFVALVIVLAVVGMGTLIAIVGLVTHHLTRRSQIQLAAASRDEMIRRGFTADEITRVLQAAQPDAAPSAPIQDAPDCEVVAWKASDDEWARGLTLDEGGGSVLIHFVGDEASEKSWLDASLIRRPPGKELDDESSEPRPVGFAREALFERDDEWVPCYILARVDRRMLVHPIGEEWTDNEWVDVSRVRVGDFQARSMQARLLETKWKGRDEEI